MASPPNPSSPAAMSPPGPSAPQISVKKRSSTFDINGPNKRRKASSTSNNLIHPLRQTSFPPEARSPFPRSPSVDSASHVSGSQVSGVTASGAPKKKRGRKAKNAKGGGESATPSLVGGKAATSVSGHGGEDKDAEEEDEDDDKAEMALEDVGARTQEQKQEEIRLRAMLVEAFDPEQYSRYEHWRAMKLTESVVKRVVNATVSQSVPGMVTTAVKAVTKLFSGDIIELARQVQSEYIRAGESQSDMPTPPRSGAEGDTEEDIELHRGPLRPEHLREAWRRYRLAGESRGVGMQQLWHHQKQDGVERFSTKTGKRMFK